MSSTRTGSTFAWLALASPVLAGDVYVVNHNGLYNDVQSAINDADDYDTILIYNRWDWGIDVHGKSLAIIGRGGTSPNPTTILGETHITSIPRGGFVLLANFEMLAMNVERNALRAVNNDGSVWLQGCTLNGESGSGGSGVGGPAAGLVNDADVQFTSCSLLAGDNITSVAGVFDGTHALFAQASSVRLFDSVLTGGSGGSAGWNEDGGAGGNGGPGIIVTSGNLLSIGSDVFGGDGGFGGFSGEVDCPAAGGAGGNGGAGIFAGLRPPILPLLPLPDVRTRGGEITGGSGGDGGGSICGPAGPPGANGASVQTVHGTWTPLGGVARFATGASAANESSHAPLTVIGAPGDRVFIQAEEIVAPRLAAVVGTPMHSPIAPGLAHDVDGIYVGTIPASGTLATTLPLGPLPPHVDSKWLMLQPQFIGVHGDRFQGNGFVLVVLDGVF